MPSKPTKLTLSLSIFAAGTAFAEPVVPVLERVAVPSHVYAGGWEHFVGGGVASFDCNGDSFSDLYAAGGENPAQLLVNASQDGHVSFTEQTPVELQLTGVIGAYPIDIDSDAIKDLVVLRVGEDVVFKGLGDCQFTPFGDIDFTSGEHWSTAFSATWEAGNTLPTLAIGTYVDRTHPNAPFETCDATLLYRPEGDKYGPPQRLEPGFCALSMLFTDWARQGRADLRVSNDRHYYVRGGQEQLWAMEENPRLFTEQDGWQPYQLWGMGIASRDITGDGYSDVYLTSMGDQKLQYFDPDHNGPMYSDATYERGTTAHRPYAGDDGRPSTGWHAGFADINNDGLDDIFVAKGNVEQMPGAAMEDPNNLLLQTIDADFVEVGTEAGVATFDRSRGAALVDFNNDGALDLAVINRRAEIEVYENKTLSGNWIQITPKQDGANGDAIGAFIELRGSGKLQTREITIGGGHASGDLGVQHFGLGEAQEVEYRVIWPDGEASPWQEADANQRITVSR